MKVNKDKIYRKSTELSNITGAITDEEFASEILPHLQKTNNYQPKFQFNFLGAELEKINMSEDSLKTINRG